MPWYVNITWAAPSHTGEACIVFSGVSPSVTVCVCICLCVYKKTEKLLIRNCCNSMNGVLCWTLEVIRFPWQFDLDLWPWDRSWWQHAGFVLPEETVLLSCCCQLSVSSDLKCMCWVKCYWYCSDDASLSSSSSTNFIATQVLKQNFRADAVHYVYFC